LYTASIDPTIVDLWSYSDEENQCLTSGSGVVQAVGSKSVTIIEQSSLESYPRVAVKAHGKTWGIDSWQTTPMVTPAVELLQTELSGIHTAVLFPTGGCDEPLPVLLDPYGGPHAQRVLQARNAYLVSQWFADQGFCVVIADGPGTPGRGDGWERSVRGDLAHPVLEAQIEALQSVAELHPGRVDLTRVGIRGWSFGGYLAALAVIRRPDIFHAAIAGAPVTDWQLYDTHYTERYLGHPTEEPDNYRRTSLLVDAGQLERPLMLIHGLADDNVVAAHTLQLSAALLAAGRPHEVLPLSGVTHMTSQEQVAENLLLLQINFLRQNLQ
jgi:dipeptidyl-peptidase-4